MSMVGTVEKQIEKIEGFKVNFFQNGKNVRKDKKGMPPYNQVYSAKETWTVTEWIEKRFKKQYSGFDVEVLNFGGNAVQGNTTLKNLRKTYYNDQGD